MRIWAALARSTTSGTAGRPSRRNLWAGYDRALRHEWAGAALFHRPHDRHPAFTLDYLLGMFAEAGVTVEPR